MPGAQVQHNASLLGTRPRSYRPSADEDSDDEDAALWDVMILDEVGCRGVISREIILVSARAV